MSVAVAERGDETVRFDAACSNSEMSPGNGLLDSYGHGVVVPKHYGR
jgi:hypothetical protein